MTLTAPAPETIGTVSHGPVIDGRRAGRHVFNDGALFVAEHDELPPAFWDRHPLVYRTEGDAAQTSKLATRVWPTHYEYAEGANLPNRLDRDPDAVLHGWLNPGYGFWSSHPDVEALEYMASVGGDGSPDAWQARLWLKPA